MNKEDTKKAISVMQAYVDGKEIQYFVKDHPTQGWKRGFVSVGFPNWNWQESGYRVKPEPREIEIDEKGKLTIEVIHKGQYVKTLIIDGPCHFVEKLDD